MNYDVIQVEQGSEKWLELRKTKISATHTAIILGLNPFKTRHELWLEMIGLKDPEPMNDKMREGQVLEEEARNYINNAFDTDFKPVVLVSTIHPFMMASLDGMDSTGKILEIKCGVKSYKQLGDGIIPEYYLAQMYKQMYVSDNAYCQYMCYRTPKKWESIYIDRDEEFIKHMIEQETIFYDCVVNFIDPNTI